MESLVGYQEAASVRVLNGIDLAPQLDMQRRSIEAVEHFSRTSTWLAAAMIILGVVQVLVAIVGLVAK